MTSAGARARVSPDLARLARSSGVFRWYEDANGERRVATADELLAVLRALDVPVERPEDAPRAMAEAERARWEQVVEPVVLAWQGRLAPFDVRMPERLADRPVRVGVEPEDGGPGAPVVEDAPVVARAEVDGRGFVARRVRARTRLHLGYHRLRVSVTHWA